MPFVKKNLRFIPIILVLLTVACQTEMQSIAQIKPIADQPKVADIKSDEIEKMLASATGQTKITKSYDPNYVVIPYPNGDVPIETGVCSDVVIRAFRGAGVDLQKEVHEDMQSNFSVYPKKWSLKSPDANIDHRRVPNLQTFFTQARKIAADYRPSRRLSGGRCCRVGFERQRSDAHRHRLARI